MGGQAEREAKKLTEAAEGYGEHMASADVASDDVASWRR